MGSTVKEYIQKKKKTCISSFGSKQTLFPGAMERRLAAVERGLEQVKHQADQTEAKVDRIQQIHEWVVQGTEEVEKLWQKYVETGEQREYWKVKEELPAVLIKELADHLGVKLPVEDEANLPEKEGKRSQLLEKLQADLTADNIGNIRCQKGKGKGKGKEKGEEKGKGKDKGKGKGKGKEKGKGKGKGKPSRVPKVFVLILKAGEAALRIHTLITKAGLEKELVAASWPEDDDADATMDEGGEATTPAGTAAAKTGAKKKKKKKATGGETGDTAATGAAEGAGSAASTATSATPGTAPAAPAALPDRVNKVLLIYPEKTKLEKEKIREKKRKNREDW